jgi:hypothetical protein
MLRSLVKTGLKAALAPVYVPYKACKEVIDIVERKPTYFHQYHDSGLHSADDDNQPIDGEETKESTYIEQDAVIEKILRHCGLPACRSLGEGRWKEPQIRPPPTAPPQAVPAGTYLDYSFFKSTCA